MITNNGLQILNGRTLGDSMGKFTCIQYGGSSVVDYLITSPGINKYVKYMSILPFTMYSDHKPLTLSLNFTTRVTNNLDLRFDKAPLRYKHNSNSLRDLGIVLADTHLIEQCELIVNKSYTQDRNGTHQLNTDITNHLRTIGDKCLQTTKHLKPPNPHGPSNNSPWFNQDLRKSKTYVNKASRFVSDFPDSDYIRQNFYKVKKTYKSLVTKKSNQYFNKLNSDIESGKVLNWTQFKRLKNQKSSKDKFDNLDIKNFENFFRNLHSQHYLH